MYNGVMPAAELYRTQMGSRLNATQGISAVLYDTETYVTGATLTLNLFTTVKNNRVLSNMQLPGMLPHPQAFHVFGIRIVPKVAPALATATPFAAEVVFRLIYNSFTVFKIGDKEFGVWPSLCLPGGAGVFSDTAGAGATAADNFLQNAAHGFPAPQAIYTLVEPIQLDPMMQFSVQMNWAATQVLGANQDVMCILDGRLLRPVQ